MSEPTPPATDHPWRFEGFASSPRNVLRSAQAGAAYEGVEKAIRSLTSVHALPPLVRAASAFCDTARWQHFRQAFESSGLSKKHRGHHCGSRPQPVSLILRRIRSVPDLSLPNLVLWSAWPVRSVDCYWLFGLSLFILVEARPAPMNQTNQLDRINSSSLVSRTIIWPSESAPELLIHASCSRGDSLADTPKY